MERALRLSAGRNHEPLSYGSHVPALALKTVESSEFNARQIFVTIYFSFFQFFADMRRRIYLDVDVPNVWIRRISAVGSSRVTPGLPQIRQRSALNRAQMREAFAPQ